MMQQCPVAQQIRPKVPFVTVVPQAQAEVAVWAERPWRMPCYMAEQQQPGGSCRRIELIDEAPCSEWVWSAAYESSAHRNWDWLIVLDNSAAKTLAKVRPKLLFQNSGPKVLSTVPSSLAQCCCAVAPGTFQVAQQVVPQSLQSCPTWSLQGSRFLQKAHLCCNRKQITRHM